MLKNLTIVVINFQTPDLVKDAVESFRHFYAHVDMLMIDNGSKDNSRAVLQSMATSSQEYTKLLFLEKNIFHGPAMDLAVRTLQSELLFFLDSDTITRKGGFLESMVEALLQAEKNYGIGWREVVNKRGFITSGDGTPIVRSSYMLLKRSLYFLFPPFIHHGMPTLMNFTDAHRKGFFLLEFPIEEYIDHLARGTASRYGYKLGIKGKVNFLLNKLGL